MAKLSSALRARCPVCGSKSIWASFGQMHETCPGCGYRFEREEGYWTGALIVAIAIVMMLLLVVFVGGVLLTYPDVPWTALVIATFVALGLAPILLYPQSKTIWVWLHITFMGGDRSQH